MKLGYFADGPWSHRALEKILSDQRFEIAFIVARNDNPDPVLKARAEELNVPFYVHENVNSPDFLETIGSHGCDLLVSMSFNQILRKDILNVAPQGFINCHAGALPFYRGRNILNWALINGETEFGITVHDVDEGIDTGDIIVQRMFPIGINDTYGSLLELAYEGCADVLFEALSLLESGAAKRTKQDTIDPVGFYCGRRRPGDERLSWDQSARDVHNFVRAISVPGPCARTFTKTKEIAIMGSRLVEGARVYKNSVGEVVGKSEDGCLVKVADSVVLITQVGDVSESGEITNVRVPRFQIGVRFQNKRTES